ncbi:MAG: HD-GYP domain-containing protein [Treponema sp.]|jgi:HD-GYP domain-containing protein (c-di-GMP phosphodiesterase class II)|nr:HD-GYP domain-containing protein [Treponema sp.]
MKKVPVDVLKAGMAFSDPVYIEGNNLLVPAGVEIRQKDIDKLKTWGVTAVETIGKVILPKKNGENEEKTAAPQTVQAAPGSSAQNTPADAEKAPPAQQKPKKSSVITLMEVQENKSAYRAYIDLIEKLDQVLRNIDSGVPVEARSIDNITGKLLQSVREERNSFIGFILGGEVTGYEMSKSSVNTAILSSLIAMELKLPNHKVMQVITGALLHDVGMLRLPKEIVEKRGGLSPAELNRIQAHPLYAYKIVNKKLLYPEEVAVIVLQHHERWDGEGYPRRISGSAIDIGARIVSVADAFEAMVSQKPYRNSMMGYQAMKNLLSDNSRRFDPDVLKAFIQTMGIYPIGSIILLNNSAVARVTEVQGSAPLRPKIRILIDEFGKVYKKDEGDTIDLLTEKGLFIARAIDMKEITQKTSQGTTAVKHA